MNHKQFLPKPKNKYNQWLNSHKIKIRLRWLKRYISKLLPHVDLEKLEILHKELSRDANWNQNYIICTICSCLIATFGLISNSTAVIIGAMLVAPLMLPLRGLAFGGCEGDLRLFKKALFSLIGATILAIFLSFLIGIIVNSPEPTSEILARTKPNLIDLGIAITAGGMSGFAKVRTGISDTLAGTAIAVALMPPLCAVGISLSQGHPSLALGAFLLYFTNLLGISLACMLVFIFSGYTKINLALGWTSALTALLFIPLSTSFVQLIQQQRLEAEITRNLIKETITVGQNVNNTRIEVIWTTQPPLVYIFLETDKKITAKQVQLAKAYINRKMAKTFELVFYVIPIQQITSQESIIPNQENTNSSEKAPSLNKKKLKIYPSEEIPPLFNKSP